MVLDKVDDMFSQYLCLLFTSEDDRMGTTVPLLEKRFSIFDPDFFFILEEDDEFHGASH